MSSVSNNNNMGPVGGTPNEPGASGAALDFKKFLSDAKAYFENKHVNAPTGGKVSTTSSTDSTEGSFLGDEYSVIDANDGPGHPPDPSHPTLSLHNPKPLLSGSQGFDNPYFNPSPIVALRMIMDAIAQAEEDNIWSQGQQDSSTILSAGNLDGQVAYQDYKIGQAQKDQHTYAAAQAFASMGIAIGQGVGTVGGTVAARSGYNKETQTLNSNASFKGTKFDEKTGTVTEKSNYDQALERQAVAQKKFDEAEIKYKSANTPNQKKEAQKEMKAQEKEIKSATEDAEKFKPGIRQMDEEIANMKKSQDILKQDGAFAGENSRDNKDYDKEKWQAAQKVQSEEQDSVNKAKVNKETVEKEVDEEIRASKGKELEANQQEKDAQAAYGNAAKLAIKAKAEFDKAPEDQKERAGAIHNQRENELAQAEQNHKFAVKNKTDVQTKHADVVKQGDARKLDAQKQLDMATGKLDGATAEVEKYAPGAFQAIGKKNPIDAHEEQITKYQTMKGDHQTSISKRNEFQAKEDHIARQVSFNTQMVSAVSQGIQGANTGAWETMQGNVAMDLNTQQMIKDLKQSTATVSRNASANSIETSIKQSQEQLSQFVNWLMTYQSALARAATWDPKGQR